MRTGSTKSAWPFLQCARTGSPLTGGLGDLGIAAKHPVTYRHTWQLFSFDPLKTPLTPKHDELPAKRPQVTTGAEATNIQLPPGDRRISPRKHVMLQAEVQWASASNLVRMTDVSSCGTAISSDELPSVGSYLKLKRRDRTVFARVAWRAKDRCGLEFRLPIDPSAFLQTIVQSELPRQPDFRRGPLDRRFMNQLDEVQNELPPVGWDARGSVDGLNRLSIRRYLPDDRSQSAAGDEHQAAAERRERIWRLSRDVNSSLFSRAERQQRFD